MEIIKFKTNAKDEEALSRVAPCLDKEESFSANHCLTVLKGATQNYAESIWKGTLA